MPPPGLHDERCTASVTLAKPRPLPDEPASPPRLNSGSSNHKYEHGSCQTSSNHTNAQRADSEYSDCENGAKRRDQQSVPMERMRCISALLWANIASRLAYSARA